MAFVASGSIGLALITHIMYVRSMRMKCVTCVRKNTIICIKEISTNKIVCFFTKGTAPKWKMTSCVLGVIF